jgi:hypothetical protein
MGMVLVLGLVVGWESVALAINLMVLAVRLLHPVEGGSHLADGVFVDGSCDLLDGPNRHEFPPAEEPRKTAEDPNCAVGLPLFMQRSLKFLNALVGMTQARCVKGLIVMERLHLIWSDLWMA